MVELQKSVIKENEQLTEAMLIWQKEQGEDLGWILERIEVFNRVADGIKKG